MASVRHTSISRKTLIAPNSQRNGSRCLTPTSSHRGYRSKTPQPPPRPRYNAKPQENENKKKKMLQYRARKDSGSQREIEEELPDYIKATTPQPHIMNISNPISLQRSKSGNNMYSNTSSSPQNDIPTFSPMDIKRESMFTFVKSQFEPNIANYNPIPIIPSNNSTPIPMIHNQLPPHRLDDFNTNKIHEIPKPPPPPPPRRSSNSMIRQRADSAQSTASMTPEFGDLLSAKQMEKQILSHYDESDKKRKSVKGFLSKIKERKPIKSLKNKKLKKRNSRNRSNSKPFNDEDYTETQNENKEKKERLFINKLHPSYNPLNPPKSSPPKSSIVHIKPFEPPRSYINEKITPFPLDDKHHILHQHVNRPQSTKNARDYDNDNEFMDDDEVAAKSFAFNRSLNNNNINMEYNREMDKMRFKCDQLDWNLNTLQTNADKDIRQITAKMHRFEHDIKTQNELFNRFESHRNNRRNSIFNSLESSIGAVMTNVESIKDALQTLDLRMSIINQRQHDIFKHIDETKDIIDTLSVDKSKENTLVLNGLDKNSLLSSRRASLQSMSQMLRLQSTRSMSIKEGSNHDINDNPLILPTYDDNEDILNPKSATKKKLMGHIRPELLIQQNKKVNNTQSMISQRVMTKNKSHDINDYGIAIERTVTTPVFNIGEKEESDIMKLASIVEQENDTDSTESELDDEKDNLNKKPISLSRRSHKHIRSSIDSALSDHIISQIATETMLIHSSTESSDVFEREEKDDDDTKDDDDEEDEQYIMNKENRRKRQRTHSRDINVSMEGKTLEIPITNKMRQNMKRKYSESFSITVPESHSKNTTTHHININNTEMDRNRSGSMSYDIAKEANITYEREISRNNDMDPLGLSGLKDRTQILSPVNDEDDSVSDLSVDSMSDLSVDGDDHGTFVIHSDTLQKALEIQEMEQEDSVQEKPKKKKKKKRQIVQLMNIKFKLQIVPNTFSVINDFIMNSWNDKASYILSIINNTASHDLFFKTSKIYSSKPNKSLMFFRDCNVDNDDDDDDVIVIDDDHLAPQEHMTFGDINIKRGLHYCGYFVFEAYPFPNIGNDCDGDVSRGRQSSISSVITPNYKTNPITPHLKPHAVLNAIDEKHKYNAPDLQFTELKLGSMSPSTVNKYRRQSLSTSSRRTSLQFVSPRKESSVTSLLGRALDEEHCNNYPWNDDLDDLIDIVIGFDIQLSFGDPQLNAFRCYVQFSEYAQPTHYHTELANLKLLKSFCNGGSDGLQLSHDELIIKMNINDGDTIHPHIVANIAYANNTNTETEDID